MQIIHLGVKESVMMQQTILSLGAIALLGPLLLMSPSRSQVIPPPPPLPPPPSINPLPSSPASSAPQSVPVCTPLKVVGGIGTSVTKAVSPPAPGLFSRNNWNTDFTVPNGANFSKYIANLNALSSTGRNFKVQMNLKYPNGTNGQEFDSWVLLAGGQSQQFTARPRVDMQPFQINMVVGGLDAMNTEYTLTVSGCN
jgi:hypothetical protein